MGSLAGAGVGALGVGLGWTLSAQLLVFAAPCLVVVGWFTTRMIPDQHDVGGTARETGRARHAVIFERAIVVLGLIAFADMLCEGAVADWAAVYLRGTLHVTAALAGLGYVAYLLTMMSVRLLGNRVMTRFAVGSVLPVLAILAVVGFATALTLDRPVGVLVGYCCLGAGLGLVIPSVFSAAGHLRDVNAGKAVAIVSSCGWFGFVLGPPLIGELASVTSLRMALYLLPLLTVVIAVATAKAKALREERG
jgi:MFS family permease